LSTDRIVLYGLACMTTEREVHVGGLRLVLRPAALAEIVALRHAVLRPGLPLESAAFDGDEEPATRHFGAFSGREAVGCLSLMHRERAGAAYQLRGMAIRSDLQRGGVGRALLTYAERALSAESGARRLWCNARVESVAFYERLGWVVVSEEFDVPGVGPHHVMVW